ncbi:variable surface protein [Plasmodium gonderi]|uniref:Variable surface protein n=1 Tax=Plasmodium gonderi TaxID=77519 RepID=A0A1Y1JP92_PLAGO|nr:variable surface protein [Plasmodium gonderi]GAW84406.1 variable surface protein [Plasmodium gonderi]
MATRTYLNQYFDFKDIFPICMKEFNDIEKEKDNKIYADDFYSVCHSIETELNFKSSDFRKFCVCFSNYLQHINNAKVKNIEPYCKYFNYLLKDLLSYYYGSSCSGEKNCYKEMIKIFERSSKNDMNICELYVNNLEANVYEVLNYLNSLYNDLDELKRHNKTCISSNRCLRNYTEFLQKYNGMENDSLKNVIEIVKEHFFPYIKLEQETVVMQKQLHSYTMISATKVILIVCIITLATMFIPFILYKNTSCRLYIEPRIGRLKEIWHKKSKQALKILKHFENDFEELMDNNSKITYNTLYYP